MSGKYSYSDQIEPPQGLERRMGALESVLFAAGEPVSKAHLCKALGLRPAELDELIEALRGRYGEESSGLSLSVTSESLQLKSKPGNYGYIQKTLSLSKKRSLSRAGAEALAIIAYNEPVTRVDIDVIRGVNSAGAVMRLLDQGLIEECGVKDAPGRPHLYKTTDLFLRLAGIGELSELPSFESFRERIEDSEVQESE